MPPYVLTRPAGMRRQASYTRRWKSVSGRDLEEQVLQLAVQQHEPVETFVATTAALLLPIRVERGNVTAVSCSSAGFTARAVLRLVR